MALVTIWLPTPAYLPTEYEVNNTEGTYQLLKLALGHRVPALIILHMTMVAVVSAVADSPTVIRHQDG